MLYVDLMQERPMEALMDDYIIFAQYQQSFNKSIYKNIQVTIFLQLVLIFFHYYSQHIVIKAENKIINLQSNISFS